MSAIASTMHRAQVGVIGLGVMGQNLALNLEDHGQSVALWNHSPERVTHFLEEHGTNRRFLGAGTVAELTQSLTSPRRILLMIKAGDPVDEMLRELAPYLAPGDIVMDGGNSFFRDTQRREAALRERNIHFLGMGVSGGEEGARHGPSLMPGGPREAYEQVRSVLESIAAKTDSGPCVTYVGPDGAGHFVKMVHNGIEYGDMQLIAEAYDILRKVLGLGAPELAGIFAEWNRGPLESYLIEITAQIFTVRDDVTGRPLVDMVLDQAGQKGTGKWTVQAALDLSVPVPTIAAAMDARLLSSRKRERLAANQQLEMPAEGCLKGDAKELIAFVHDALYASKICAYTQGMRLIGAASEAYGWDVCLKEIARIWKGGCIIRARLLDSIMQAYEQQPGLSTLLLDSALASRLLKAEPGWRRAVATALQSGVPIPAMSAALSYFDTYRAAGLPQNLTQAQRDYFGAHTYQRMDQPEADFVHTDWPSLARKAGSKSGGRA